MPIPFTCPHCGIHTSVDDRFAGCTGACSKCGNAITIPHPNSASIPPYRRHQSRGLSTGLKVLLGIGIFCVVAFLITHPANRTYRRAEQRVQCANNLKTIGKALQNYHETHRCFPPAVITDEAGNPRYSWRVAILPYIEQGARFDKYDFSVPWNAPANQSLVMNSIDLYHCPSDGQSLPHETNYVMITGARTFGGLPNQSTVDTDITDGASNTIAVVEIVGAGIAWAEPRDLTIEELSMRLNDFSGNDPSSHHPGGLNVLLCDGSTTFLPQDIDPVVLENLVRCNDGNSVRVP